MVPLQSRQEVTGKEGRKSDSPAVRCLLLHSRLDVAGEGGVPASAVR